MTSSPPAARLSLPLIETVARLLNDLGFAVSVSFRFSPTSPPEVVA